MDYFTYQHGRLHAEQVDIETLASTYGTPLYVYSKATLERHWHAFDSALKNRPHLICYAVKANSNLAVLQTLAKLGSGFDIVSGGELMRVIKAGGDPAKTVFSGVGKTPDEMLLALNHNIRCFNIESEAELLTLQKVASKEGKIAPVSFRVNPDVDALTHPYISTGLKDNKFGITIDVAERLYLEAQQMSAINIKGMDCHIGSQLTELSPFVDALDRLLALIERLKSQGIYIEHLDLGGGLGVRYQDETPPLPDQWAQALSDRLATFDGEIIIEPGRAIAANAGILVSRIINLKAGEGKHFAVTDAAMNDLIRPSLYSAWQDIVTYHENPTSPSRPYDIVGPICETGDFLGKERQLSLSEQDLIAVRSAGAYGFVMSSNYNSRPRAAEVMVDGEQHFLIRERETLEDIWKGEALLP